MLAVSHGSRSSLYGRGGVSISRMDRKTGCQATMALNMVDVPEFGDDDDELEDAEQSTKAEDDGRTDMEKELTHGYEGDFKVGDLIRVTKHLTIYSVPTMRQGFDAFGITGKVTELALYGRKHNSLCSAITPIKCLIEPGNDGVPEEIKRRFFLHFDKNEVELM